MPFSPSHFTALLCAAMCSLLLIPEPASAQYFGRNKVQYDSFDFSVLPTENFDIYFYEDERSTISDVARMAERWTHRHEQVFGRKLSERKPLIFYANDADFQQTNVISGFIGAGTGGVTESLKERVVMPLTGSYQETHHVLGHELVHSFQYDIGLRDTTGMNLQKIPLWFIEGMSEYLSLGREDTHTAMWLRDAALRDDLPTMEQLATEPQNYFPYRFGHAYSAYIGAKYGDRTLPSLFYGLGHLEPDSAFVQLFGITADSLSREWIAAVKDDYLPATEGRTPPGESGREILSQETTGGEINVSPAVSPDGRYVAFLSERDLFYVNLFVADARTGEIVHDLDRVGFDAHFDAIRFIKSAGSWSPDGRKLVFVAFDDGDNELAILDLESGDIERQISVRGVEAMLNPAWSPDGQSVVFSGMDGGISDLYLLDIESGNVRQLTNDSYADLQPAWSPDGQTVAFVTDRGQGGTNLETLDIGSMRLGLLSLEDQSIRIVNPFQGHSHHNPQYAPDGRSVFFISDQDGFKDIYRVSLEDERVHRITRLQTGVSGISGLSPAMSVAGQSGRVLFSVFSDGKYSVYGIDPDEASGEDVARQGTDGAGTLPPTGVQAGLIAQQLKQSNVGLPADLPLRGEVHEYNPSLSLDYVAPPTIGVSVGSSFGTGLVGGVGLYFSDMLGDHNLGVAVSARGTVKDIGGQVSYFNRGNRINYGASVAHIPFRYTTSSLATAEDPETGVVTERITRVTRRIFSDEVNLIGSYPFSTTTRFDLSAGAVRYGFDYEADHFFVYPNGLRQADVELESPDALYFFQSSAAFVRDYSFFGFTSPLSGGRYRLEVAPLLGSSSYVRLLADLRRYFFFRPVSFAVRALHVGNYGASEGDPFSTQYLGYAYNLGFVRGYSFFSFDADECTSTSQSRCAESERLSGTRIAVASAELRLPLVGNEQLGLLNFRFIPTDLSLFFDAGLAWTEAEGPVWEITRDSSERIPVFSTGVSSRFNVLGRLVVEIYYAVPFQRPEKDGVFGFRFAPGW